MAGSAAAHAGLLAILAVHAPQLNPLPQPPSGPPEPIIPVLIMPKRLPPPAPGEPPDQIRLHRRPQRFAPHAPEPLPAPSRQPERSAERPRTILPPPEPEVSRSELRAVLRSGSAGCANPAVLSEAERERCVQTLGAGARFAPYRGPAFDADKMETFERAARAREASRRYRDTAPAAAPGGRIGTTATEMGEALGDTRR